MEINKPLEFRIMITFPELIDKVIENHNSFNKTDFEVVNIIYDKVPFCDIKVTKFKPKDIFSLGYKLAAMQYQLRADGKLDW